MHFTEIKKSIKEDLLERDLKMPSIRINAIESVEKLLQAKIAEMKANPTKLIEMLDKNVLKNMLAEFKDNGRINDAESSIVNEIYYRLDK